MFVEITLSGRGGGGGGLRDSDDQTYSCQSETSYSMMPKLVTFSFILKTRSEQMLSKLINQRGCYRSFLIETSQKF